MKLLVWQWGKRGGGPRYALELAAALRQVPGVEVVLSLSRNAEIMADGLPACDLPVDTYRNLAGWAARMASLPWEAGALARRLSSLHLDGALCAMPAPLDLRMVWALRRLGLPYVVAVHDATLHPGDILPMQAVLQRMLISRATAFLALSEHVGSQLHGRPILRSRLSPHDYGHPKSPPMAHGGKLRLLSFGRLLPYKGLDLLVDALALLPPGEMEVRVVGSGPETAVLETLRRIPGVSVENRWVPEAEIGALLAWADALVLSHREASQSGVAAAAMAAGRWVVATQAGGIAEQLAGYAGARLCDVDAHSLAAGVASFISDPPPPMASTGTGWRDSVGALATDLTTLFTGFATRRENP